MSRKKNFNQFNTLSFLRGQRRHKVIVRLILFYSHADAEFSDALFSWNFLVPTVAGQTLLSMIIAKTEGYKSRSSL